MSDKKDNSETVFDMMLHDNIGRKDVTMEKASKETGLFDLREWKKEMIAPIRFWREI